jgi:carboxypeptidase family protein
MKNVHEIIQGMQRLLLFLVVSSLMVLPVLAADLTKLKIVVTTQSGKPIERASVVVRFGGRSVVKFGKMVRTSWEMRSTQEGVADIPEMPKGKIRVQVIAKGYQTFGQTFDVAEDQRTIEIKLNPPQPQYSSHEPEKSN